MVLECRHEGFGKVCKSKGGLTAQKKRMQRAVEVSVRFGCEKSGWKLETEGLVKTLLWEQLGREGGRR